jgi:molybdopterin-guanine dinucleotide biosynthesis protein
VARLIDRLAMNLSRYSIDFVLVEGLTHQQLYHAYTRKLKQIDQCTNQNVKDLTTCSGTPRKGCTQRSITNVFLAFPVGKRIETSTE